MKVKLNIPAYIATTLGGEVSRQYGEINLPEEVVKDLEAKGFKLEKISSKKKKKKKKSIDVQTQNSLEV